MPVFAKRTLSNYLRSECKRRLALDLWPDVTRYQAQRIQQGMPPKDVTRPGLNLIAQQGEEWEERKIQDLISTLGSGALVGTLNSRAGQQGQATFIPEQLRLLLLQAVPGRFLTQAQFGVINNSTFETALAINHYRNTYQLDYAQLRPDLIQVFAAGTRDEQVLPNGTVQPINQGDTRLPLRIIDIKLTAEPSNSYFAEIAYYAMALAGWLVDEGLSSNFFVASDAAVWPGSHDASTIVRVRNEQRNNGGASFQQLMDALESDLEVVPFHVFAARLRRFFSEELEEALSTPWRQLEWHVDNRCSGCDYLGYHWNPNTQPNPDHCWPMAQAIGHLSQVAFVSKGARSVLEEHHVTTIQALAGIAPTHQAYSDHQNLRATRTVVASRAQSLDIQQVVIPPQSGTSAIMPKWADLRLIISADFDIGSGLTAAFGFKAFFYNNQATPVTFNTPPQVFPVDQRDPLVERRELVRFLTALNNDINRATQALPAATLQVYIWDSVTFKHLVRVIGRHLDFLLTDQAYLRLIWLFPPEEVMGNPDITDRKSPITIVRDVVRAVTAVPVPHYYNLLSVARVYLSTRTPPQYAAFNVPLLFHDPLADQIPSERIHEVWARSRNWSQTLGDIQRVVSIKLYALESITQRLSEDLQGQLGQTAPRITLLRPPSLPRNMAPDSRLWFLFAKLNIALAELEIQQVKAMPDHEREARFRSALLPLRITGNSETIALQQAGLQPNPAYRVYELAAGSCEVKAKEGDFTFALAPMGNGQFLGQLLGNILSSGNIQPSAIGLTPAAAWVSMETVTQATVRHLNRDQRLIILELNTNWWQIINQLETLGVVNLSIDAVLDPIHKDFLASRLESTLRAIGNPPIATPLPFLTQFLGSRNQQRAGNDPVSPVAEILWNGQALFNSRIARNLPPVQQMLTTNGYDLNQSQWGAWESALTRRLSLIWGPPGTGKSLTLRAIVLAALHEARLTGRSLRILITGPTYEAIDNVLTGCFNGINSGGALGIPAVSVSRLRSSYSEPPMWAQSIDVETGSASHAQLLLDLRQAQGLFVVAGTPQQIHRLLDDAGSPVTPLFDLIIVDEASQIDVATATLPLAGLANQGAVVIAGDPKQLPPIHQARPAENVADFVGPIYTYLERRHNITPSTLEINYRSNQDIVSIGYEAGYPRTLQAADPNKRLQLLLPIPGGVNPPTGWSRHLPWSAEWASFLDPTQPAVSFIYNEGRSSQSNAFEALAVAALVALLEPTLADPRNGTRYITTDFWKRGIGIVTPHRAQQALVVRHLQQIFPTHPIAEIRGAVDTVERFQGQERDVIIGSYAVGDPDTISHEEEFLMSLNRFNVMVSRAKVKLIVFGTRQLVNHLASERHVLDESGLLKRFFEVYCSNSRQLLLPKGGQYQVAGELRWH